MKVVANYKVLCNDGTYDVGNGKNAPCINKGGQKQINPIEGGQAFMLPKTLEERNIAMAQTTGKRDIFTSSNLNMFAKASIVPIGLYAFSKYQKYDTKKTLKVTIIGSVVILGAVVLNGLSGAWSGTTYLDSLMGKSKKPLEPTPMPQLKVAI